MYPQWDKQASEHYGDNDPESEGEMQIETLTHDLLQCQRAIRIQRHALEDVLVLLKAACDSSTPDLELSTAIEIIRRALALEG